LYFHVVSPARNLFLIHHWDGSDCPREPSFPTLRREGGCGNMQSFHHSSFSAHSSVRLDQFPRTNVRSNTPVSLLLALTLASAAGRAPWLNYRDPGVPRTPDGRVDLIARLPCQDRAISCISSGQSIPCHPTSRPAVLLRGRDSLVSNRDLNSNCKQSTSAPFRSDSFQPNIRML